MTSVQKFSNKFGEVSFRKQLVKQHSSHAIVSPGEPDFAENLAELKNRLARCEHMFTEFATRGITFSPFLEIAAGQGYRSDLLVNEFGADGFATDISQHSLASDRIITKELKLKKHSVKICCDAYNLPFVSNSFPFVFIALSLHHFPDPAPVINEAIRVLTPTGYFFFDEEPIKQGINLNLWRRDYHLRWFEKILKYTLVLIWLSRIGRAEVDHGILEETFSLETWEKALSPFPKAEVYQSVFPFSWKTTIHKSGIQGWIIPNYFVRLGLFLFGGGIGGLAQIKKRGRPATQPDLFKMLGCPTCRQKDTLTSLHRHKNYLICSRCKIRYTQKNHVWMLLTPKMSRQLYGQKT